MTTLHAIEIPADVPRYLTVGFGRSSHEANIESWIRQVMESISHQMSIPAPKVHSDRQEQGRLLVYWETELSQAQISAFIAETNRRLNFAVNDVMAATESALHEYEDAKIVARAKRLELSQKIVDAVQCGISGDDITSELGIDREEISDLYELGSAVNRVAYPGTH